MISRCPHCTAEVPEEARCCPRCGWDFSPAPAAAPASLAKPQAPRAAALSTAATPPSDDGWKGLAFGALGLIALTAALAGVYFALRPAPDQAHRPTGANPFAASRSAVGAAVATVDQMTGAAGPDRDINRIQRVAVDPSQPHLAPVTVNSPSRKGRSRR